MPCEDKARLVEEHHRLSLEYSLAALALQHARSRSTVSEYQRLRRKADDAQAKSKVAGLAVKKHIGEHGC